MSGPDQSPSGDIRPSVLSRLVAWIAGSGASGCLEIRHGEATSRAFFRDGRPCGSIVLLGFKPLGLLLLENDVIGIDALEASLVEVLSSGRPQGQVLVEHGHLTPEKLSYWLHVQQRDRLHRLLGLTEGTFRFDPNAEPPPWTEDMELSPHLEVLRFFRSQAASPHTSELIATLGDEPVLLSSFDPVPVFGLDAEEASLVDSLARVASAREAVDASELPADRAEAVLAALTCFHYVTPSNAKEASFADLPEEAITEALASLAEEATEAEAELEPVPESKSWRAPHLGTNGLVRFETAEDLDAAVKLFIMQGALLVATEVEIKPGESVELSITAPAKDARKPLTCVLTAIPEEGLALLRITNAAPAEVVSFLRGEEETGSAASMPEEARPAVEEARPAVEEARPAVEEARPAVGEARPAVEEARPAVEEARPAVGEARPAAGEARPAVEREVIPPIPTSGSLEPPGHPSDLLSAPWRDCAEAGAASAPVSPMHLLAWLRAAESDLGLVISTPKGNQYSFEVLSGTEVQASVEIQSFSRSLAEAGARYEIHTLDEPPHRRIRSTVRTLVVATVKALLRNFDESSLADGLGARMSLSPRLSSRGRRAIRGLGLSAPQERVASHALDGTRKVPDILTAGIGPKAAWELLYLLEMRDGFEWVSPPEKVEDDPVASRWQSIQGKDHFEVLGVHWSSHPASIERAHTALRELYGPSGRLRSSSPELASKLWAKMSEAHSAISTKEARKAYRKERYPSMNFAYQAELLVGQARLAMLRGDLEEAKTLLESALDMAPISSASELLLSLQGK